MKPQLILATTIASLGALATLRAADASNAEARMLKLEKENTLLKKAIDELKKEMPKIKKEALKEVQKEGNRLTKTSMERSKNGPGGSSDAEIRKAEATEEKELDTLMGTEPAFVAMGITGADAPQVTTPRKFASGIISGADKSGKFKQGVAFSTNLGLAYDYITDGFAKCKTDKGGITGSTSTKERHLPAYKTYTDVGKDGNPREQFWVQSLFTNPSHAGTESWHWLVREFYRSNLSFATARGVDKDDKTLRLSVGLSTILYDHYDPYIIFHEAKGTNQELSRVLAELGMYKVPGKEKDGGFDHNITACALSDEDRLAILNKINSTRWVRSGVQVGFAPDWFASDSKLQHLSYEGYTAYLSLTGVSQFWLDWKHGVPKTREKKLESGRWQEDNNVNPKTGEKGLHKVLDDKANLLALTAHVRYRTGEQFTLAGTSRTGREDSLFAAGRLTFGSRDINAAVEGGYLKVWNGPKGNEDAWHVGGAISTRVAKNTYFVVSTGQTYGAQNEYFATGSFRFGTSDTAGLIPKQAAGGQ